MQRVLVFCLTAMFTTALAHQTFAAKLSAGDKAPNFEAEGVDGKQHRLDDLADAKAVVVCFTCNHCPVAIAYENRFIEFTKQYEQKGVAFVAINVNPDEADGLEAMKERAEQKGFNFPYLKDASGDSARGFGARVTPHLFVLGKNRELVYQGAFDDSQSKPTKHYVREAVDAVLAGKKVARTETRPFGCGIRIRRR